MLLERFLDPSFTSLKICGVTTADDALRLVELGVDALGVNFWPKSKRYLAPENASWLREMEGRIFRVGVFVNGSPELPIRLVREGYLDCVQLHGDETVADSRPYRETGIPFIKAIGVKTIADLENAAEHEAQAVLLDAHAPGVYGGTGKTFDWDTALDFKSAHPQVPMILAGGIVPENAAQAALTVAPCALDVASGAEHSPGIKDFDKVRALLEALGRA